MSTLALFFLFLLAATALKIFERLNRDRLQVIQEALRDQNLDEASRRDLVAELSRSRGSTIQATGGLGKLAYAAGWICLCIGAGLFFESDGQEDGALAVLASGLGLLSLPIVLREFDRGMRKH
jgi:hypothetical protein